MRWCMRVMGDPLNILALALSCPREWPEKIE